MSKMNSFHWIISDKKWKIKTNTRLKLSTSCWRKMTEAFKEFTGPKVMVLQEKSCESSYKAWVKPQFCQSCWLGGNGCFWGKSSMQLKRVMELNMPLYFLPWQRMAWYVCIFFFNYFLGPCLSWIPILHKHVKQLNEKLSVQIQSLWESGDFSSAASRNRIRIRGYNVIIVCLLQVIWVRIKLANMSQLYASAQRSSVAKSDSHLF